MDSMGDRLRAARKAAGFSSARSAALKFGWRISTYAAHENGQNDFDPQVAASYAKRFKTTGAWLLTGEGSRAADKGTPVVGSYDPDAPEQPLDPDAAVDPASFPPDAIKELANKAGMGSGQTISTTYVRDGEEHVQRDAILDEYWRLPPPFVRAVLHARTADLLVVECEGDSMKPTLQPGERVIVNTAHKRPSPDGIYAIRNQLDDTIVKRLELFGTDPPRVRIVSDNPAHAPQERGLDEIVIVGKVVAGVKLF